MRCDKVSYEMTNRCAAFGIPALHIINGKHMGLMWRNMSQPEPKWQMEQMTAESGQEVVLNRNFCAPWELFDVASPIWVVALAEKCCSNTSDFAESILLFDQAVRNAGFFQFTFYTMAGYHSNYHFLGKLG